MHTILLFLAKYLIGIAVLTAGIYWLLQPRKEKLRLLIFGAIALIITVVLMKIGAALYYDPRPFVTQHITPLYPHGPDNGFPSDHTILAAAIAVILYSSSKRIGLIVFGMAFLIGLARVLGHIHSPIDIVGSFVFALIGGLAAYYATPRIMRSFHKPAE
jgi:undecaprenyl-diphosphatase